MSRIREMSWHRRAGATLLDVVACFGAIGVLLTVLVPTLANGRSESAIAQCANNLRLLAWANHNYADDHEGEYFLDSETGEQRYHPAAHWWDRDRAGQYLNGTDLRWKTPQKSGPNRDDPNYEHAGLGGGTFVCPSDRGWIGDEDAAVSLRSYHQNFWASSGGISHDQSRMRFGSFFNRDADVPHDRLILFGEKLALTPVMSIDVSSVAYATGGSLGASWKPSERFTGVPTIQLGFPDPRSGNARFGPSHHPVELDYGRHTSSDSRLISSGRANFAMSDGHVDLVDTRVRTDAESLNDLLWSPIDALVEENVESVPSIGELKITDRPR